MNSIFLPDGSPDYTKVGPSLDAVRDAVSAALRRFGRSDSTAERLALQQLIWRAVYNAVRQAEGEYAAECRRHPNKEEGQ